MLRPTTLATLSVLAFSGCIATPASAQYLYGNLHGDFAHGDSYSHHDHGHNYHYDSHHQYHGHSDYHRYGHITYPATVLSRHHVIPVYTGTTCPYGNGAVCSEPIGCPLQRSQALPGQLNNEYQPGVGVGGSGHNHPHNGDSHSGHSHDGHSHEGHSHDRQIPGSNVAPSDRGYLAPPSLPRGSANDFQPQTDFRRAQPKRDDSIRMETPPPSTFGPSSPNSSERNSPKRFDTPPPATL